MDPGTSYQFTFEPKLSEMVGDPKTIDVTTKLGDSVIECSENDAIDSVNEIFGVESDQQNCSQESNLLAQFTCVVCNFAITGRYDNITISIEPNFRTGFRQFTSSDIQILFTKLTPGENYKISAVVEAGPWLVRNFRSIQTQPAKPLLFHFEVKFDNSIQMKILLHGKGTLFSYHVTNNTYFVKNHSEKFAKYKYLAFDPTFYGLTFTAFVTNNGLESEKVDIMLEEVKFFNVIFGSVQEGPMFYFTVNFTLNSLMFDEIRVTVNPDLDQNERIFPRPDSKSTFIKIEQFLCGRDVIFTMVPYDKRSGPAGPGFETGLSLEPCAAFSQLQSSVNLLINEQKSEISVTVPIKGEVSEIDLHFSDRDGNVQDFHLTSKYHIENFHF